MRCTNRECAAPLPPQARFCPRCGAALQTAELSQHGCGTPSCRLTPRHHDNTCGGFLRLDRPARFGDVCNAMGESASYALAVLGIAILGFVFTRLIVAAVVGGSL